MSDTYGNNCKSRVLTFFCLTVLQCTDRRWFNSAETGKWAGQLGIFRGLRSTRHVDSFTKKSTRHKSTRHRSQLDTRSTRHNSTHIKSTSKHTLNCRKAVDLLILEGRLNRRRSSTCILSCHPSQEVCCAVIRQGLLLLQGLYFTKLSARYVLPFMWLVSLVFHRASSSCFNWTVWS